MSYVNAEKQMTGTLNVGNVTIENNIIGAEINAEGHLILYMATGEQVDCGEITERDPTVPDWAKTPVKPVYSAEDVGLQEMSNLELEELLK